MKRDRSIHEYNGWKIESVGGYSMMKHFIAEKGELWHWCFKLYECKEVCDLRDAGKENEIEYFKLYTQPLYR